MPFISNAEYAIGQWVHLTKDVYNFNGHFTSGTRMKIIGNGPRGLDFEDEHGNQLLETGIIMSDFFELEKNKKSTSDLNLNLNEAYILAIIGRNIISDMLCWGVIDWHTYSERVINNNRYFSDYEINKLINEFIDCGIITNDTKGYSSLFYVHEDLIERFRNTKKED